MKPKFDKKRPLSWSAISSFDWDPEQWWEKYCLHQKCLRGDKEKGIDAYCSITKSKNDKCPVVTTTAEMIFGSKIGKQLETDPTYLPIIRRQSKMEFDFKVKFGKIDLVGYADSFCDKTYTKLEEYKTGKKAWTQERADEHGQITMYCLMNWIARKIEPEEVECCIWWMPTKDNGDFSISFIEPIEKNIQKFYTKRTKIEMLAFGSRINKVYKEMEEYCKNHAPV